VLPTSNTTVSPSSTEVLPTLSYQITKKQLELLPINYYSNTLVTLQPPREVAGNPWQCDCYLEWLRLYLLSRQVDQTLTCSAPKVLVGTRMSTIRDPLVCCEYLKITVVEMFNTKMNTE